MNIYTNNIQHIVAELKIETFNREAKLRDIQNAINDCETVIETGINKSLINDAKEDMRTLKVEKTKLLKELKKTNHEKEIMDDLGGVPKTPEEFLDLYFARNGIVYDMAGLIVSANNEYFRNEEYVIADLFNEVEKHNISKITRAGIDNALTKYKLALAIDGVAKVFSQLAYSPEAEKESAKIWKRLARLCFNETVPYETIIAILKHWIQQVKRKQARIPIKNHIMPIVYGSKQGSGKSTWVKDTFLKPISGCVTNPSFDQLVDQKTMNIWDYLVAFVDEMMGVDKADSGRLKAVITQESVEIRKMNTNSLIKKVNNLSFIGTSNEPLDRLIFDSTGVRRFFQLSWRDDGDLSVWQKRWDEQNNINYMLLWQSVDLNTDYLKEHLENIRDNQAEFVNEKPFDVFIKQKHPLWDKALNSTKLLNYVYKPWLELTYPTSKLPNAVHLGRWLSDSDMVKRKIIDGYSMYLQQSKV